jgi:NUMOD3 motif
MNIYYVYAYIRSSNNTPYYIGKGSGNRAWKKGKHEVGKPTDPSKIIIIESNLTEIGAYALERRYIEWYGRKDIGTGILRNRTEGGDGRHGCPQTEYQKKKVSEANKGRIHSQETKTKMSLSAKGRTPHNKGVPMSEEQKQKLRKPKSKEHIEKIKNRIISEETKLRISQSKKGCVPWNKGRKFT